MGDVDSLEARIAEVLREHAVDHVGFYRLDDDPDFGGEVAVCVCGALIAEERWPAHAASVVAALFTQETRSQGRGHIGAANAWVSAPTQTRWVSSWEQS